MADVQINFITEGLEQAAKLVKSMKDDASKITFGVETDNAAIKDYIAYVKKLQTVKAELNKETKTETDSAEKLNLEQKTYADLLKQIEKQEAKLKTAMTEKAKDLERLRQATQKQNEANKQAVKLEENEAGSINDLRARIAALTKERNALGDATGKNKSRITELNKELDKHNKVLDSVSDKTLLQNRNIGNYRSALEGLPGPIGNAASAVGRLGKAFLALITNPVALTIAAIGVALASVGKAFLESERGADVYEKKMTQLKTAWSVYLQSIRDLGSGETHIFKHFKDANRAAGEYADTMDRLNDAQIMNLPYEERLRRQIEELKLQYGDANLSLEKRIELADEAKKKFDELAKIEVDRAKTAYEAKLALSAKEFTVDQKLLDHFIKANSETGNLMLSMNSDLNKAINAMGMDGVKELKELFLQEDKIIKENDKEKRRTANAYNTLVHQSNEQQKKETADNAAATKKALDEQAKLDENYSRLQDQKRTDKAVKDFGVIMKGVEAKQLGDQQVVISEKQVQDEITKAVEDGTDDRIALAKKETEEAKKAQEDKLEKILATAQAGLQYSADIVSASQSLNDVKMQNEIKAAGDNQSKVEEIEKKYAKKRQKNQLALAYIDMASAVMKALSQFGFPIAIPFMAAAAAAGGIQIAAIKAQKFAKGGEIDGRLHSQGGTLIEAEKGEYVVNRKSTGKYKRLIEGINEDNQMKIMMSLNQDRRINVSREQDKYTKLLYEHLSQQEIGYETPEYFVIRKGTKTTKLRKK